ncbi:MAG: hypothetical protein ACYTGN_12760 [Planctomycetota bacterium]
MKRYLPLFLVAIPALLAGAVTVSAQGGGSVETGKKMFHDTGEDLDYPSCAHCHATVDVKDEAEKTGHIKPAFPVFNTAHRGGWKNKPVTKGPKTAGDAGNICVVAFQKRGKKLPAGQVAHLNAYLQSVSPGKDVKPRKINYAPKIPASLDGGDKAAGEKKVQMYCGGCHGQSDDHLQSALKAGRYKKSKVAMKVRGWIKDKKTGKPRFKANNGMMSFFAKDRLPDKDLLDILAYLGK